eukprot:1879623-Ditylum_brightwellii.AAC.1
MPKGLHHDGTQKVYHTKTYCLDKSEHTVSSFNLQYGSGISVLSVPVDDPFHKSLSTPNDSYSIFLVDGSVKQVSPTTMAASIQKEQDHPTLQSSQPVLLQWIGDSKK